MKKQKLLLDPNPRNPRVIAPERITELKQALALFGDLGGIVFNRRTGRTVGGHQRIQAFVGDDDAKVSV